jgi:hypothetical protein
MCWRSWSLAASEERLHRWFSAATRYGLLLRRKIKLANILKQVLRYGDKTHVLETREAPFRQELYRTPDSGSDKENEWDFEGVVGHVMTLRRAEQGSKGLDIALEALKNSMETIKQAGEAKR